MFEKHSSLQLLPLRMFGRYFAEHFACDTLTAHGNNQTCCKTLQLHLFSSLLERNVKCCFLPFLLERRNLVHSRWSCSSCILHSLPFNGGSCLPACRDFSLSSCLNHLLLFAVLVMEVLESSVDPSFFAFGCSFTSFWRTTCCFLPLTLVQTLRGVGSPVVVRVVLVWWFIK